MKKIIAVGVVTGVVLYVFLTSLTKKLEQENNLPVPQN
jgi:hypothetical protein